MTDSSGDDMVDVLLGRDCVQRLQQSRLQRKLDLAVPPATAGSNDCSDATRIAREPSTTLKSRSCEVVKDPISSALSADSKHVKSTNLQRKLAELKDQPRVRIKLPAAQTAGLKLKHAVDTINYMLNGKLAVYKIGITLDPEHRFFNNTFGYKDDFDRMIVIGSGSAGEQAMLEAALIAIFDLTRPEGLQNVKPGGEGHCSKGGDGDIASNPWFTYFVFKYLPLRPTDAT